MDPMIDRLINDLRHTDAEVRRGALDKLSKVEDRKHVVTAIHWTMLNDIDDDIRVYAREIYIKMGEGEKGKTEVKEPVKATVQTPPIKVTPKPVVHKPAVHVSDMQKPVVHQPIPVAPENRPHIKAVLEHDPNIYGAWSVHLALISIGIIILATMWHMGFIQSKVLFLDILGYIGLGCTVPGIILGIIGLRVKDKPTTSALWGIILNTSILLIGAWNIVSAILWKQ